MLLGNVYMTKEKGRAGWGNITVRIFLGKNKKRLIQS